MSDREQMIEVLRDETPLTEWKIAQVVDAILALFPHPVSDREQMIDATEPWVASIWEAAQVGPSTMESFPASRRRLAAHIVDGILALSPQPPYPHGLIQTIRGMCTDERPYPEIDQALVRLDDMLSPQSPKQGGPKDCPACGAPRGYPPAGPGCVNHGTPDAYLLPAQPSVQVTDEMLRAERDRHLDKRVIAEEAWERAEERLAIAQRAVDFWKGGYTLLVGDGYEAMLALEAALSAAKEIR
jgi:hypothetical protein